MNTTNFGINPAPVIPTPVPSAGVAKGYSTLPTVQPPQINPVGSTNPILDAAAGPKCNIIWVESMDEVLAHPTSPNEEMYFQDKNNPVIYRRETDANGNVKNPIHVLHFTVEEIPFGPEAQFVTKDEHPCCRHERLKNICESLVDSPQGSPFYNRK